MKKLKISRLTPDSRYLQTVALKNLMGGVGKEGSGTVSQSDNMKIAISSIELD